MFFECAAQLQSVMTTTTVHNGIITFTIKFLHFFVAKSLQVRVLPVLQSGPSSLPSLLFWVTLTHAVSSMSDDSCSVTSGDCMSTMIPNCGSHIHKDQVDTNLQIPQNL